MASASIGPGHLQSHAGHCVVPEPAVFHLVHGILCTVFFNSALSWGCVEKVCLQLSDT